MSEENKREEQATGLPPEGEAVKPADGAAEAQTTPAAEASQESPAAEQPAAADKPAEGSSSDASETGAEAPAKPADAGAAAAPSGEAAPARRKETDEEKAARRKAAFEARQAAKAAAAQAKADAERAASAAVTAGATAPEGAAAQGEADADAPPPPPPSPNQPRLDRAVALLREHVGPDAVEEAYINEPNDHLPTIVMKDEHWAKAAPLFRDHDELGCNYLRNVSGVDYETHMEVVYYPLNMQRRETYCIKVRTDREQPSIPSVTPVWETANWHEREIFDLLGIDFPGHPNMTRIMMPDDWIGHPLRKDYVPLDPEV